MCTGGISSSGSIFSHAPYHSQYRTEFDEAKNAFKEGIPSFEFVMFHDNLIDIGTWLLVGRGSSWVLEGFNMGAYGIPITDCS